MSDYMPKCATCEHFESCIIQKHLTEMALILWNISKAEDKADRKTEPQTENLFTDKDGDVWEWRGDAWYCISGDEPQTSREKTRDSRDGREIAKTESNSEKPNNSKEMDYFRFMDERKMDEELAKRFKERSRR